MKQKKDISNDNGDMWERVQRSHVPHKRGKKYNDSINIGLFGRLLKAVERDEKDFAVRIPLDELPDAVDKVRAVVSRKARQAKIKVATSTDDRFFYVELAT